MVKLAIVAVAVLATQTSTCSPPAAPMPQRSNTVDFVVLNRTAISGFAEIYVVLHAPTGKCYVVADPAGEGGGAITTTEQVVCMHYTRVEHK